MKVVLIVYFLASTSGFWNTHSYPFPDMETCFRSVQEMQIRIPEGGDSESAIAAVCVPEK